MMYNSNLHIIINPTAGRGHAARIQSQLISAVKRKFGSDYSLSITRRPGDGITAAREAIETGTGFIIAIGGDGTVHEVINGVLGSRKPVKHDFALGIVNCGTGSGLAQTLGLPSSPEKQLDVICHQSSSAIDVGHITFCDGTKAAKGRFFISECQIGIGGTVVANVKAMHKYFGGTLAFGSVAFMKALSFKAPEIAIQIDDGKEKRDRLIGMVIGNGIYCGGGMKLTPYAEPNDGQLDVLLIHDMPVLTRVWNFPKIYSGSHVDSQHFTICRGKHICVSSEEPVLIEADGELLGSVPCEIEVIPNALQIKCSIPKKLNAT